MISKNLDFVFLPFPPAHRGFFPCLLTLPHLWSFLWRLLPKTLSAVNLGQRVRCFSVVLSSSCSYLLFICLAIELLLPVFLMFLWCACIQLYLFPSLSDFDLQLSSIHNFLPFSLHMDNIQLCSCPGAVSDLNYMPCAKSATCFSWSSLCTMLSKFLFCAKYWNF